MAIDVDEYADFEMPNVTLATSFGSYIEGDMASSAQ